jgi:hypothetical protein
VPFSFEHGHVTVRATIKDGAPVEVILSTGSEYSRLDWALMDKYKLSGSYSGEWPVTGRNDRIYIFSTVHNVRVGGLKGMSLDMREGSLADVSRKLGREIFGVLGADYFRGRVAQFDFGKKVVRFLPQSPPDPRKGAAAAGRAVLPMRFYKEWLTLPVSEQVTFDGKKIKTNFDTGVVTVVSLSAAATKQIGLESPPEKGAPRPDKVKSLRLNEHELNDVPVMLYAKGSHFDLDGKDFGAVAGAMLLQDFVATFDFRKKVIILERM